MPIRKDLRKHYAKDWLTIRMSILDRAENKCEGSPKYPDCRAPNGWFRDNKSGATHPDNMSLDAWAELDWPKLTRIVLTVAHKDHNPENNNPANLAAWCQRCHLTHDAKHHRETAAATKKANATQLDLLP